MAVWRFQVGTCARRLSLAVGASVASVVLLCSFASPASALPEKFFGMTAHESMNNSEPDWEALQNAGVQKFRMQIKWETVENAGVKKGGNWRSEAAWVDTYDQYFEKAAKHGIAILPLLYTRKGGNQQYYWPQEPAFAEWAEFVWTVVQRYGKAGSFWVNHPTLAQYPVGEWEVWNEPNLKVNSLNEVPDGEGYGEFLKATSATIHNAQKEIWPADGAKVLFGGLYQEYGLNNVTNYINAAAKVKGLNSAYDGLSIHPYSFGGEEAQKLAGVVVNIEQAFNAQNSAMGAGKTLWVTESGWPVGGQGVTVAKSPEEQASLLSKNFAWLKANATAYGIEYAAWYLYKDVAGEEAWDYHAGLRDAAGAYRPSWFAYQEQAGAPRWPHAWYSQNLGGSLVGDPDICSWGASHVEIFGRGTDNALWHKYWNGSTWSSWESLGGSIASGPGCVSWGANRLDVVARASNGNLLHWWWDGSSWQSYNHGGNIVGDPDVASWGPNRLDIFGRAPNGSIAHKWWDGSSWKGWENIGAENAIVSGVGAAGSGGNRIDVVGRAANDSVVHLYYVGGTWYTYNHGGVIKGDPDFSSWGPGYYDIWARGSDDSLYVKWWTGSAWSPWETTGQGPIASSPGAVSFQPNRIDVVTVASNGSVGHYWWW